MNNAFAHSRDGFEDDAFDHVVLSRTLQTMRHTQQILAEMLRVGREAVVSFPNFAYWKNRMAVMGGRMPVSEDLPYEWFDTPNLHLATPRDFEDLLAQLGLKVTHRAFLADGKPVGWMAAQRSTQAIYRFCVR